MTHVCNDYRPNITAKSCVIKGNVTIRAAHNVYSLFFCMTYTLTESVMELVKKAF